MLHFREPALRGVEARLLVRLPRAQGGQAPGRQWAQQQWVGRAGKATGLSPRGLQRQSGSSSSFTAIL